MCQPEYALAIEENILDIVAGEGVGVERVVVVGNESLTIVSVQPILRGEPKESGAVLNDALYAVTQ